MAPATPVRDFFSSFLLAEHETREKVLDRCCLCHGSLLYFQMFQGDWITRPTTTSQTSVTGMKIFQPSRMIWS